MNKKYKTIIIISLLLSIGLFSAHGIGISLSYFIPRNGYFSNPVSPLSFRDIGVNFGRYIGVAGNLSFYNIGGMGIKDANNNVIETGGPVVGPTNSILGSLLLKLILPIGNFELTARGGIFGFYNIDPRLMAGTLDRYIAGREGRNSVTSDFGYDGTLGWGWVFGGTFTYYIQGKIGISAGALYYLGGADMNFSGTYNADADAGLAIPAYLRNVKLDYSGLELIVGVSYKL